VPQPSDLPSRALGASVRKIARGGSWYLIGRTSELNRKKEMICQDPRCPRGELTQLEWEALFSPLAPLGAGVVCVRGSPNDQPSEEKTTPPEMRSRGVLQNPTGGPFG
jgi:hypothetical protein